VDVEVVRLRGRVEAAQRAQQVAVRVVKRYADVGADRADRPHLGAAIGPHRVDIGRDHRCLFVDEAGAQRSLPREPQTHGVAAGDVVAGDDRPRTLGDQGDHPRRHLREDAQVSEHVSGQLVEPVEGFELVQAFGGHRGISRFIGNRTSPNIIGIVQARWSLRSRDAGASMSNTSPE
jgi:hypothetical protein